MKVVILAGGFGSRLSEETEIKPKPMVEIGGKPILWHIMKIYAAHGLNDFVVCLGYKGYVIKEYFFNYFLHNSNITIDIQNNTVESHEHPDENWRVTLVDTGLNTQSGGRLKRVAPYLDDEPFCFTYGDGVADIDISKLVAFHGSHDRTVTVTGVVPPGRFGVLETDGDDVVAYTEKPTDLANRINGGFFVLDPSAIDAIGSDDDPWERAPMESLCRDNQIACYQHDGFWYAMDTLRDKNFLEAQWSGGTPPWKIWRD